MFNKRRKSLGTGERVYIFAPTRDLADDFLAMTNASADFHNPWVFPATDARRFRGYLDRLDSGSSYGFCIARRIDDALLGVVNINDVVMGGLRSGTLGYYVAAEQARRGYMSEGLSLVLDHAFTALDLNRLESNIQPTNVASIALVKRLGFRKEGYSPDFMQIDGQWRDHERWAMLAREWMVRKASPRQRRSIVA